MTEIHKKMISKIFVFIFSVISVFLIAYTDHFLGSDISFILLYLIPISAVTWKNGKIYGIFLAVLSTTGWFLGSVLFNSDVNNPILYLLNIILKFIFYIIFVLMLSKLKYLLDNEKKTSRSDPLTGIFNRRAFFEYLEKEVKRMERYDQPVSLVYIDLDNFKTINDHFGHNKGDEVLKQITGLIKKNIRKSDIIARFGGDEFVIMFLETDETALQNAVNKLYCILSNKMQRNKLPITFSIGAVTFYRSNNLSADKMVKITDELMYSVKNKGKNHIKYNVIK